LEEVRRHVDSMPERMEAVIKNKGGHTSFWDWKKKFKSNNTFFLFSFRLTCLPQVLGPCLHPCKL
jgi:hypothetical protein